MMINYPATKLKISDAWKQVKAFSAANLQMFICTDKPQNALNTSSMRFEVLLPHCHQHPVGDALHESGGLARGKVPCGD
jgi:hypothetical protein